MKILNILKSIILVLMLATSWSCQKGELFQPTTPDIVELAFSGSTSVPLEFVYDEVIVDTTVGQSNSLPNPFRLNISKGDQKILIREKGKTAILKTYTLSTTTFQQKFNILYDEGKIYEKSIFYNLHVIPLGKAIEFFIDGKRVNQTANGELLSSTLTVPIDKDQERTLSVKIKGENEAFLTKIITDADSNKTLKFLLDGEKLVEHMELPALKNAKGMSLTLKFKPTIEFGQSTFLGGDVDLVFYLRDMTTEEVTPFVPEIRITVPVSQSFATVELPPLPEGKLYTFDVVRKGINQVPYTYKKFTSDEVFPVLQNQGRYGTLIFFKDLNNHYFLPGERLVCTISVGEEQWGENYDEVFIVPGSVSLLNDFINIQ
ncbi:MAG: hypothetical protein LBE37_07155 [Sphingobacterium sp.]|jgi:hypothetical protein|nr:hypothetical protein [Sphingobacterium sp.]